MKVTELIAHLILLNLTKYLLKGLLNLIFDFGLKNAALFMLLLLKVASNWLSLNDLRLADLL